MAAEDRDARTSGDARSAFEDSHENCKVEIFGERRDIERADRHRSHGVDVRERICSRDSPEIVRVVDDRRKEVDRLHERKTFVQLVNAGIVTAAVADEDSRVGRRRNALHYATQFGGAELRRTACAGGEFGEADDPGVHRTQYIHVEAAVIPSRARYRRAAGSRSGGAADDRPSRAPVCGNARTRGRRAASGLRHERRNRGARQFGNGRDGGRDRQPLLAWRAVAVVSGGGIRQALCSDRAELRLRRRVARHAAGIRARSAGTSPPAGRRCAARHRRRTADA